MRQDFSGNFLSFYFDFLHYGPVLLLLWDGVEIWEGIKHGGFHTLTLTLLENGGEKKEVRWAVGWWVTGRWKPFFSLQQMFSFLSTGSFRACVCVTIATVWMRVHQQGGTDQNWSVHLVVIRYTENFDLGWPCARTLSVDEHLLMMWFQIRSCCF